MSKIFRANLYRLIRDRIFHLSLLAMFLFVAAMIVTGIAVPHNAIHEVGFDRIYYKDFPFFSLFAFAPISFFLGTERSEGGIRKKLTVGHTRAAVYLADLATGIVIVTALYVIWTLGGLIGLWLFGSFKLPLSAFFLYLLLGYFTLLPVVSMLTLAGHLIDNKALTVIVSVLLVIILILGCSALTDRLMEPERKTYYGVNDEMELVVIENAENPLFLTEPDRTYFNWLARTLPLGQQMLIADFDDYATTHPVGMIAISLVVTAVLAGAGMLLFRKKDLK